jgi:nitronate monooxygenase
LSGLPVNFLDEWLKATADALSPAADGFAQQRLLNQRNVWSAGHSVSGISGILSVAELVDQTRREYGQARQATAEALQRATEHRNSASPRQSTATPGSGR